ncbi:MAG: type II toxin-antitoxin system VapC family toxin [Treponematales bacterium]
MAKRRCYIDSSLIIEATRTENAEKAARAIAVLRDPGRGLVVSDYVKLETVPKMRYNKRPGQVLFTETILNNAEVYVRSSEAIITETEKLASAYACGNGRPSRGLCYRGGRGRTLNL